VKRTNVDDADPRRMATAVAMLLALVMATVLVLAASRMDVGTMAPGAGVWPELTGPPTSTP